MKSLFKIAQSFGHMRTGSTKPDELSFSTIKTGTDHKAAVFTIGAKIRHEMRWLIGDRVDVLYDPQLAEGQLVRCKEGGWAVTGKNADGPCRVRLNVRPEFQLPNVEERLELAYEVTNSTICFAFPTKYRTPAPVVAKVDKPK